VVLAVVAQQHGAAPRRHLLVVGRVDSAQAAAAAGRAEVERREREHVTLGAGELGGADALAVLALSIVRTVSNGRAVTRRVERTEEVHDRGVALKRRAAVDVARVWDEVNGTRTRHSGREEEVHWRWQ
jgi:hypothetical protein